MTKINYYTKTHTINRWVKVITDKFHDIEFSGRAKHVANILGITASTEKEKIKKASLIVFGKQIGVESFDTACKKLGISTQLPIISNVDGNFIRKFIAEYKLIIIIKALNEGWYPNWTDVSENKYWPWFNLEKGFSYWTTDCNDTFTDVPSALVLKNSNLAEYCGMMFIELYKDLYE